MAAFDCFLKIDGVDGESSDHKHKNEIGLLSFSWGESNLGASRELGGHGAGKVQMQDFHFTARTSKASPMLFLKCAGGDHIAKAVLTCRKAGGDQKEFLVITMNDLIVSSYQCSGGSQGEDLPHDSFSLNFAKVEWNYQLQDLKGGISAPTKAGWNIKENKKV